MSGPAYTTLRNRFMTFWSVTFFSVDCLPSCHHPCVNVNVLASLCHNWWTVIGVFIIYDLSLIMSVLQPVVNYGDCWGAVAEGNKCSTSIRIKSDSSNIDTGNSVSTLSSVAATRLSAVLVNWIRHVLSTSSDTAVNSSFTTRGRDIWVCDFESLSMTSLPLYELSLCVCLPLVVKKNVRYVCPSMSVDTWLSYISAVCAIAFCVNAITSRTLFFFLQKKNMLHNSNF